MRLPSLSYLKDSNLLLNHGEHSLVTRHRSLLISYRPYGGLDIGAENRRYFQGLCFAQDMNNKNADSNFYAYPLPIIPVMDAHKKEIVRIDRLATGGKGDSLTGQTHSERVLDHCQSAEYVPEMVEGGLRQDVKPINITQPDGPSFKVTDDSLVEWQKWSFRISFNPREGAVLHDVNYDGGAGNCANNLSLGCDCLGVIKYFDAVIVSSDGEPVVHPNVICLHEQDNGIGWKVRVHHKQEVATDIDISVAHKLAHRSCRRNTHARTCRPIHHHPSQLRIRLRLQA
jgi:primary-amine oxidase